MTSRLKHQSPVRISVGSESAGGPASQLLDNLPMLHVILESIVEDWHRAVSPYESRMAEGGESSDYVAMTAFLQLQPAFLKSLFSYVFFFVAADRAYGELYAGLNRVNILPRVDHGKPPVRSGLIERAQRIRDWSIAHFPSEKASSIDAEAAMSWTPMTISKPIDGTWNIRELTFGGFRISITDQAGNVTQSGDLEMQGLDSLHRECLAYLEAYDVMCADYLAALHRKAGA